MMRGSVGSGTPTPPCNALIPSHTYIYINDTERRRCTDGQGQFIQGTPAYSVRLLRQKVRRRGRTWKGWVSKRTGKQCICGVRSVFSYARFLADARMKEGTKRHGAGQ